MNRPVIEEISPDEQPGPFDAELDKLLSSSRNDAYKVLSTTFGFLKRKTAFFERADASKQLARLLRDVKAPAAKAANGQSAATPPAGPRIPSGVRLGVAPSCCDPTCLALAEGWYCSRLLQNPQHLAARLRLDLPQHPMGRPLHLGSQRRGQPVMMKRTTRTRASVSQPDSAASCSRAAADQCQLLAGCTCRPLTVLLPACRA